MPQLCFSTISKALFGSLVLPKRFNLSLKSTSKVSVRNFQMDNGHSDNSSRGALVVLEGLDRSGKTSQTNRLVEYLERLGISTELWRFPDRTTCVGEMISSYLVNKSELDDRTIHLLFSANRWEKRSLMESKLRSGTTLIVDRYSYSGVAFSSAKGLDIEWCKAPEMGLLAPDLVVYLDIPPEEAAARGGYGGERYEQLEFQKKVSQHYQILHDATWKIIDACLPMEEIEKQLRELVLDSVTACKNGKPLSSLWLRSCNNYVCSTLPEKLEVSNPGLMRNPTDLNDAINACNDKSLHRFPASYGLMFLALKSMQHANK